MDFPDIQLESARLLLKPLSLEYTTVIFQEFTAEITRFMFPKPARKVSETMHYIRDAMHRSEIGTELTFVILKKETGEFLGVCAIHQLHTDIPELGIWTKKSAHGNGYGREAIHCLKAWTDANLDYESLSYPVDKRNSPSRKIPESLGGKIVREFRQINLSGDLLDQVEYRIYRN